MAAASPQDRIKAPHIAFYASRWMRYAVTDPRLGRQMNNRVEVILCKQAFQQGLVADIALNEAICHRRSRGQTVNRTQTGFFERDGIIIIQIVQAHDARGRTLFQQPSHQMGADKAGTARNKNPFQSTG